MAYGARRFAALDRAARIVYALGRACRLFVDLATRQASWSPGDVYAAAATARFLAAHQLIDRAEAQIGGDPDTELIQIRQPLWFGGSTIHEETD